MMSANEPQVPLQLQQHQQSTFSSQSAKQQSSPTQTTTTIDTNKKVNNHINASNAGVHDYSPTIENPSNNSLVDEQNSDANDVNSTHLTLRSLVSTKEAGIIIGKGGKNVQDMREATGVAAAVSKLIPGVHERILTIAGPLESVASAYSIIARHLRDNPTQSQAFSAYQQPNCAGVRLLVAHQLMGSVIGKGGSKIKDIQEVSGAKIVVSKDMLPQSTERVIDIYGGVDSINVAVKEVGNCILGDIVRAVGTIPYDPKVRSSQHGHGSHDSNSGSGYRKPRRSSGHTENGSNHHMNSGATPPEDESELETKSVPIHAGLVGCIIGKGGVFINEIRRVSGARVSISKLADPATNQRTFTVTGTDDANEKALSMLFTQLEIEKERRLVSTEAQQQESKTPSQPQHAEKEVTPV